VCIVYEAIKDRIGDGCLFDVIVPAVDGQLSYDHCGRESVSVFHDLQEITSFGWAHGSEAEIVDDEDFGLSELFHDAWVRAIGPSDAQILEEAREPDVERREAHSTCFVCEGAGKIGFTNACGACDDDVLSVSDPVAVGQTQDQRLIDAPRGFEVDILDAGTDFESGILKEPFHFSLFLPGPLLIDEEREALIKREVIECGMVDLFFESLSHAIEFHVVEFFQGGFHKHWGSPF
jgi:hypothetical protein